MPLKRKFEKVKRNLGMPGTRFSVREAGEKGREIRQRQLLHPFMIMHDFLDRYIECYIRVIPTGLRGSPFLSFLFPSHIPQGDGVFVSFSNRSLADPQSSSLCEEKSKSLPGKRRNLNASRRDAFLAVKEYSKDSTDISVDV